MCGFAALAPGLRAPLLHDSYGLVYLATQQRVADIGRLFYTRGASQDFFFRPLAYGAFWVYARWAGWDAFNWHLFTLCGHLINACLVFVLARRLLLPRNGALIAALLFAVAGSRAEAVTWVAARVDVLAMAFVLCALLLVLQLQARGGRLAWALLAAASTAALLSKESAFCLPFLAAAMLCARTWTKRSSLLTGGLVILTVLVFFYRHWVLGSIGGYGAAAGHPDILQFSPMRSAEALAFRMWGTLTVPVNWSVRPNPVFWLAAFGAAAALAIILWRGTQASRRLLLVCIGMIIAAALPAQHLLLLPATFSGARVEYLPSLGFALFWGAAIGGLQVTAARWFAGLALIAFQAVCLEHNLAVWRTVAEQARTACSQFAELASGHQQIAVRNLPMTRNGVPFLSNSFTACVLMNSRLKELPAIADTARTVYVWDDAQSRFSLLPTPSESHPQSAPSTAPPARPKKPQS